MKKLAETIEPGSAALFVSIKEITTDKVVAAIKEYGGVVLKTSFDETKEQALRDAEERHRVLIYPSFADDALPAITTSMAATLQTDWQRCDFLSS